MVSSIFSISPTENLEISFISTKAKRDDGSNNLNLAYQPREVTSNVEGYNRSDILSHVIKVEYSWDDYNFQSITSKRDFDMEFENDFDFSSATKFHQYEIKAYELVNAKLGYEIDSFDIYLYGKPTRKTMISMVF
nr:hypothetical protein [Campylobacterota bacterium]